MHQDFNLLQSKGITHILNLAAGDVNIGAPALDISNYKGMGTIIKVALYTFYNLF